MFGAATIVKNSDKEKWVYSGYGIAFYEVGSWNFGNNISKNVVSFGVDNSLSSHGNNRKNNVLVPGEGPACGINGSFGSPEKKFSINFSKENTKFCLSSHYIGDNSYFLLMKKKSLSLKPIINFPIQLSLGSISNGFGATEPKEVS